MVVKGNCEKICLVFIVEIGYFYIIDKNKCNMFEKMEIKKFDLVVCKYVIYKEVKIK